MQSDDLIRKAKRGDLDAFNALVLQYQDAVYSVAYRIMGEPAGAADATQEAFISAYRKLATFRDGNFRAWLLRIATNTCYDTLRYHKRRPATPFDELSGAESDDGPPLPADSETPEEAAMRTELQDAIQGCIGSLTEDQRTAIVLCDMQGYSYQEIAEITSVSLGTVKSRISRARTAVRDCLRAFSELLPVAYRQISDR